MRLMADDIGRLGACAEKQAVSDIDSEFDRRSARKICDVCLVLKACSVLKAFRIICAGK